LRHGFQGKTLEDIGKELGVTRERVKQIDTRAKEKIYSIVVGKDAQKVLGFQSTLLRIQSALIFAEQMGMEITYQEWEKSIVTSGLVGKWSSSKYDNINPLEVVYMICDVLARNNISRFQVSENLVLAVKLAVTGKPDVPAKALYSISNLSPELRKAIRRHRRFSGGVNVKWLAEETKKDIKYLRDVLKALGFKSLSKEWFVSTEDDITHVLGKNDVFHHGLRKMFQYCGPLDLDEICGGMRHVVSRTNFPIAPPAIIDQILESYGYRKNEGGSYYWDGEMCETLTKGEIIIMGCMRQHGSVVHHIELAQSFLDSELSFPALHATLNHSPLFAKVDQGLYKLRGKAVTPQETERARNVADRVPVNLEVRYDKSGNIIVRATLGILAVAVGAIYSEQLPNLSGEWKCFVHGMECEKIIATEKELRHIQKPIKILNCEVGARLEFIFNTWQRSVTIQKIENSYAN